MVQFTKIAEAAVDTRVVNVMLATKEGVAYGRIVGPSDEGLSQEGRGTPAEGVGQDWTQAAYAVHHATKLAEEYGTELYVVDPEDLWHPEWGELQHGTPP